jgi:dTDP-4-dehydrorhamnose 3,5-epimerase
MPMDIRVVPTEIEGLLFIEPEFFQDDRGFFFESYSRRRFEEHGLDLTFVQDNHSRSVQGVVRGFHYQTAVAPQYRLVRCTVGEVWDVVVDLRVGSPTLGRWFGATLTAEHKRQLLIPPEFAHGFCVRSAVAEVQYKITNPHNPEAERIMAWNDPDIGVPWPVDDPILSPRDRDTGMSFKQYLKEPAFVYRRGGNISDAGE